MSLEDGASIHQYKIINRIGGGGMGEVYLAEDTRLRRKVALKLLSKDITKNEDWVRRFEQEARAASSLNHPNIITIYEIGHTDESHFISTEFIEIGEELGVRAVLSGQVVKRNDSIIVTAELIDIRDQRQLWGEQRPVKVSDFSLVRNEIVNAVSKAIGIKLNSEEKKRKDAETLYLKGRNSWNKRTANNINEAINDFNEALKLDPTYAPAYAGLADCYNMLGTYGAKPPREAFPQARDAAIKALALDNNLAEGHAALAYATFRGNWNWPGRKKHSSKPSTLITITLRRINGMQIFSPRRDALMKR